MIRLAFPIDLPSPPSLPTLPRVLCPDSHLCEPLAWKEFPPALLSTRKSRLRWAAWMQGSLTIGGMAAARCFSCFRSSGFWGEVLARGSPAGVRRLGLGDSSLGRDKRQVRLEHQPQALGGPSWEKGLSCLHGFSFESWKVGPASEALSRGPGALSAHTAG